MGGFGRGFQCPPVWTGPVEIEAGSRAAHGGQRGARAIHSTIHGSPTVLAASQGLGPQTARGTLLVAV